MLGRKQMPGRVGVAIVGLGSAVTTMAVAGLEQGSQLVGIGSPPPGALSVPLNEAAQQRLGGPAWFNVSMAERLVDDQYALYRDPGSSRFRADNNRPGSQPVAAARRIAKGRANDASFYHRG